MTAPRLHLARIAAAASFDDQANALLAQFTPQSAHITVTSPEEAWNLAQYVDLVDAGYGNKNLVYSAARMCLATYVRKAWQDPEMRGMFGRSAILMAFVDKELDQQEATFNTNVNNQPLAA